MREVKEESISATDLVDNLHDRLERANRRRLSVVGNRRDRRSGAVSRVGGCRLSRAVLGSGVANLLPTWP